jgi:hypothetical protein
MPDNKGKEQLQTPAPVVVNNHLIPSTATHVGKGVRSGKKSKRPPPLPKTEQVSDSVEQFEKKWANPPLPGPKPTKIADLMKRFEN